MLALLFAVKALGDEVGANAEAWKQFRMGEFNIAIRLFNKATEDASKDAGKKVEALYGLACSYDFRQPNPDRAKAAELYKKIISEAPESSLAAWSDLALSRQLHTASSSAPDYAALEAAYGEVYRRHSLELAGQEAFLYMEACRLVDNDKAEAKAVVAEIDVFFKDHPSSKFASAIWSLKGSCHEILEDDDSMLQDRLMALKAKESDPLNPFKNNAGDYWAIATLAEFSVGDLTIAKGYYGKIVREYPTNVNAFAAKQALKRIDGIEAGLAKGVKYQPEAGK